MRIIALCDECSHHHPIEFDPIVGYGAAVADWYAKHSGHEGVTVRWPTRSLKKRLLPHGARDKLGSLYLPNADVKVSYGASAAVTITLASLAASSTLLAGRESTAIDNGASNKYLDELLAGFYRTGASNLQAGRIVTAVVGSIDDTPTWPDVFDGTDSAETVTLQSMFDQVCRVVSDIVTDATQRTWPFGPVAIASLFGGVLPDQWLVFVTHSAHTSTNAWSSTEGDHGVKRTPVYATVA